jgi:hypothetical protein
MSDAPPTLPKSEIWGVVLWPAFLAASATVGVLFTLVDPVSIHLFGSREPVSRQTAHSLGFILFWFLYAVTSYTSVWLHRRNLANR